MIEPNNEKTFNYISFYTADEKLCDYEKIFGEKFKQPGQIDSIRDTMTAYQKPRVSRQNRNSWNVCIHRK